MYRPFRWLAAAAILTAGCATTPQDLPPDSAPNGSAAVQIDTDDTEHADADAVELTFRTDNRVAGATTETWTR